MTGRYYPGKPAPRAPSDEDKLQRDATLAAAEGIIEQLKRMIGKTRDRRIASLKRVEIEHLAIGAIKGYSLKRSEQEAQERDRLARERTNLFL